MSLEAALLIAPWRVWPQIARDTSRHWLARPLFALFVYGCAVSLTISGRVTARLILPAMLNGIYAPALQIAALAIVCRGTLPVRRAVDLFFAGYAAVSLPLPALSAAAVAPFSHWTAAALVMVLWSGYVDYWFFRSILRRSRGAAWGTLLLHRLLWGIPALAIAIGPAAWQELVSL